MAPSIEQISFELTAHTLAEQERALSALRACAGTVLGSASIAGSFLGARAGGGALDVWGLLAMASCASCLVSAIWVLAPHELAVAFCGDELLADGDARGIRDIAEAYRAAGGWIEARLETNRRKIDRLADWLTVSCLLLASEVIFWTISLVD
jgi:hypothetical protein